MESVRFLASLFALEFEPRTYLPSLETHGDVPIGRLNGDLALPEAEATPEVAYHVEVYAEKYPMVGSCPPAPLAQIIIPAADPLHLGKFDESPFSTLFSVVTFDEEPSLTESDSMESVSTESVFPTLFRMDLDMISA